MDMADHVVRHRLADLFLDTFYYNAHTTASDALLEGLPVVTCIGEAFAGRVAASILNAAGLPELITHSHADYEALALELATHPEKLSAVRQKLAQNRASCPLFNTTLFTKHFEDAFVKMQERSIAGLRPADIAVRAMKV
jgi:predicted O-linked N-acetylglucosamine transferase (SPINDLY family)